MKLLANKIERRLRTIFRAAYQTEVNSFLLAKLHIERIRSLGNVQSLQDVEFRVFSQWGEDGIIQYLISKVPIPNPSFIEFGVGYYFESNTRFLLMNDNWRGLVIEGVPRYVNYIQHDEDFCRRYNLTALCTFITRETINTIFENAGFVGDIGLLSIDVDGNDYWLWETVEAVRPRVVICEYNSVFGADFAISVPYDPSFIRRKAHFSDLYFGASLAGLCHLAEKKGYDFVGSNSAGVNAFFVRKDISKGLRKFTAKEGYVESQHRESRDIHGKLTYIAGASRLNLIRDLQVIDVVDNKPIFLREIILD